LPPVGLLKYQQPQRPPVLLQDHRSHPCTPETRKRPPPHYRLSATNGKPLSSISIYGATRWRLGGDPKSLSGNSRSNRGIRSRQAARPDGTTEQNPGTHVSTRCTRCASRSTRHISPTA
jgi:hypothetical protein